MARTEQVFLRLAILSKIRIEPKSCTGKKHIYMKSVEVPCKTNVKHNTRLTEECPQYVFHSKVL